MKNQQAVKSFLFLAVLLCGTFSACGKAAAAGNAKSFFKPETAASSSKDGSIFPGGECTSCNPKDKDGSIFPGGSCVDHQMRQLRTQKTGRTELRSCL